MKQGSELEFDDYFQAIQQEKFKNRFPQMKELGTGSGSNVYSAFDKLRNHEVAIKMYNKTQLKIQYRLDITRQVQILKKVGLEKSDYFVQFYHAYKIKKLNQVSDYCLIEEKCVSSLQGLIKSEEFRAQPQKNKLKLCLYIAEGLQVLHNTHNIMHRDLKPANFLMAIRNGQLKPILSDFGHSKEYQADIANTTYRGSLKYVNPYIISSDENFINYSFEFDVYSLGIIFLQILTNKFLFEISKVQSGSPLKFIKKMSQQLENTTKLLDNNQNLTKQQKIIIENCLTNKKYTSIQVLYDLKKLFQGESPKSDPSKFTKNKTPQRIVQKEIQYEVSTFQAESNSEKIQFVEINENGEGLKEQEQQQKMIISSCNVDSKITMKKKQKILSDICISTINNEQEVVQEKQKMSVISSQPQPKLIKQKSLCLKRLQSVEQKLNVKIETSKADKIPKAISTFRKLSANLDQNYRSFQELEKLKKFEKQFLKIKSIESYSKIAQNDRNKLMIFGLVYMTKKIENQCAEQKKDNQYTQKYTQNYLQKLRVIKQESIDKFLSDYGDKLGQKRRTLLKNQDAQLNEIRLEFDNIAKSLDMSQVYSQLKHILD